MIAWLKANWAKHTEAIIIAAALVFVGRFALLEHDARLQADAKVKTAESTVTALQAQQKVNDKQVQTRLIVLRQQAAAVDTPAKAIAALPAEAPEVQAEPLPGVPDRVSVLSVPLYQDLNQAAQTKAELAGCEQDLTLQKAITAQKDVEVQAEKRKPGFFHRLGQGLKVVGCSAAGGAIGGLTKSPSGPAIGAGAGAALCQMF